MDRIQLEPPTRAPETVPRMISPKTVERLSLYRQILLDLQTRGEESVFSHNLADAIGNTSAQVRRDLMAVNLEANGTRGYPVAPLIRAIGEVLDAPVGERAALVGVGHLGQALLAHVQRYRPRFTVMAAFDTDPIWHQTVIANCQCYPVSDIPRVVRELDIRLAILAVPERAASEVAHQLVVAGIRGILNFAPTTLRVPDTVYVENIHFLTSLEKVSYFARHRQIDATNRESASREPMGVAGREEKGKV